MFRISEHTPYFGIRTDIVTFMVSPVSVAERAVVDIDRTKLVTCTGNFAYKDKRPVNLFYQIAFVCKYNVFHGKSACRAVICHGDKWNIFTDILSKSRDFTLQRLIHALHSCQGTPCLMKTIFLSLSSGKRIDCIILVRD